MENSINCNIHLP